MENIFAEALPILEKVLQYIKVHRDDDDLTGQALTDYLDVVDYCDAIYGIFEFGIPENDEPPF